MPRHSFILFVAVCTSWPAFVSALHFSRTAAFPKERLCLLSEELGLVLDCAPFSFGLQSKSNGAWHQLHFLDGLAPRTVQPKQSGFLHFIA